MNVAKIEQSAEQAIQVVGELNFDTVGMLWKTSQRLFMNGEPTLEIDLKNVTKSDSSGLVLMLAWMREAKQKNITLRFKHIPTQLLAIAKVGGLVEIISSS